MDKMDTTDYKSSCTNPTMETCLCPNSAGPIIYATGWTLTDSCGPPGLWKILDGKCDL